MTKSFDSHRIKRELLQIVAIGFGGGMFNVIYCCLEYWPENLSALAGKAFQAGVTWVVLWKGNEYCARYIGSNYSWRESPITRLIIATLVMIVYSFLAITVLIYIKFTLIDGHKFSSIYFQVLEGSLFMVILISFAIYSFMHGRGFLMAWREEAIEVEKLKTENLSAQYNSLKNQVNPHFLFNSLNALSSLVYENQDKAVGFIKKLSEVYRYVLDTQDRELVPLAEEMEFIASYIYLQKIRFDDRLTFNIRLEDCASDTWVAPLAVQMLIENAIKHNIISASKPLIIDVYGDSENLIVKNNLQEKIHKDSTGIGLDNIKLRYQHFTSRLVKVTKTKSHFMVSVPILSSL